MTWNWDLSLLEKIVVNVQCATMKNEIIRKPMVLERAEVNLLKMDITTTSKTSRRSLTYIFTKEASWLKVSYKEASGEACQIWHKLRLMKDMATFQTLQTW